MIDTAIIEKKIGYEFKDKSLLVRAFTHPSFSEFSYERLEFLGDSVLEIIVSEYLFINYKNYTEGDLTLIRANIVDKPPLIKIIKKLGLDNENYLLCQKGLLITDKVRGNLYESILGAIYIDAGLETARKFVIHTLEETIIQTAKNKNSLIDYKSKLINYCAKNKISAPQFLSQKEGKDNECMHSVNVVVDGKNLGFAKSTEKKVAEKLASEIAYKSLKNKTNCK